jgi:hypothetical protein
MPSKKKPIKKPIVRKPAPAKVTVMANPPKSPKGKPLSKAAIRRKKVVAGVVAGKTAKEIAAETGIAPDTVSDIKEHPEFARTLAEQLARHQTALDALFDKSMQALDEMLASVNPASTRFGVIDRLLKIYEIMQPKGSNLFVGVTLEELERRVKEST